MPPDRLIEPVDGSGADVLPLMAALPYERSDLVRLYGVKERLDPGVNAPMLVQRSVREVWAFTVSRDNLAETRASIWMRFYVAVSVTVSA